MAITGNASYIQTMDEFIAHWSQCNTALAPGALVIGLPNGTSMTRTQFETLRASLLTRETVLQGYLNDEEVARAAIDDSKTQLLAWLVEFNETLDGYYQSTTFYKARPLAPGFGDGQYLFTTPMVDALTLWEKMNAAAAPPGITLPLTLADGTVQGGFASAVSLLQFQYKAEKLAAQNVVLARAGRVEDQTKAYAAMLAYRKCVPPKLKLHPTLVDTMPRLTPLPGHTPDAVSVSGVFQAPDAAKVVYTASTDPDLKEYQLRGTIGNAYNEEDAVTIATHQPGDPREFITTFGLGLPGARIALKVFVILNTDNESGSATVLVQRPAA